MQCRQKDSIEVRNLSVVYILNIATRMSQQDPWLDTQVSCSRRETSECRNWKRKSSGLVSGTDHEENVKWHVGLADDVDY